MTIERGDTLGPVLPDPDPEPQPKMSIIEKLAHDIAGEEPAAADPFDLGIAATVSGRNLRALEATTSFQRRPSRYT